MSVTSNRVEGSGASMLKQAISIAGASTGLMMSVGTVTSSPPSVVIEVEELGYPLERDDFLISEHIRSSLTSGDRVLVLVGDQEHVVICRVVRL